MNTLIDFIKIILSTGLIIYVYFALIKKLSNNIKVVIFPLILFIISILYGYGAYKKSDDIILIIWIVLFSTSILFIILIIEKVHAINLKKRNPIENIINKTNLNHNYQTNIETIDNSSTLNISQTNNHLEQINNVTNIESKQSIHKKRKEEDANSSEKTNNNLSEERLRKIYNFFIDNNILVDYNLEFEYFKVIFLKQPIRLKADIPTLREFYNHLSVQNNIRFKNINTYFLTYFINSKNDKIYDYKQFTKDSRPISNLTDEILELFKKF